MATIEEVKKAKIELEKEILKLFKDFEKKYGVKLGYISIERKNDNELAPARPDAQKPGPPLNVNVSMDIDF